MIETLQKVIIKAPLDRVWDHARDIERWAALVPGMQTCQVIDADNSRWVLKVGVGGMVRTVTVDVRVDRWDGPGHVAFTYTLVGDPVTGGGAYDAAALDDATSEVTLTIRVEGSGALAPMWEAMGRPLLPQLARGFGGQLRDVIEAASGPDKPAVEMTRSLPLRILLSLLAWLRRIFAGHQETGL